MAAEMSYHLTGLYPDWWQGKRFDTPIIAWAIGITSDSTRKVLQKELLGTSAARDKKALGTGAIPRDYIDLDTVERDGNIVKLVRVAHHTNGECDGWSTLEFRSTQQGEHTLMGASVHFIWCDEEDPNNSEAIYSQCITRTATTNGQIVITATPENGRTPLVNKFLEDGMGDDKKETIYCQNATWDDAPHLTEAIKKELLENIPEWQHEMRALGLPVVGQGIVFNISDEDIACDKPMINNWWEILWSLDIGSTSDPIVLTLAAHDTTDDIYYIVDQTVFDANTDPKPVADYIKASRYPKAIVIPPHDSGDGANGSPGFASLLRGYDVNVSMQCFYNPSFTQTNVVGTGNSSVRAIEPGLWYMKDHFKSGKLKVSRNCESFFKEKHTYFFDAKSRKYKGQDHSIDSARYGFMSLLGNRGIPAGQCQKDYSDFNNGFTIYSDQPSW